MPARAPPPGSLVARVNALELVCNRLQYTHSQEYPQTIKRVKDLSVVAAKTEGRLNKAEREVRVLG